MFNKIKTIVLFVCLGFASLSQATDLIDPISEENPTRLNISPVANDGSTNANGTSPFVPWHDDLVLGKPLRYPALISKDHKGKISTNKWYTDLLFLAKQRGKLYDDFRTAVYPLNIKVADELLKNDVGAIIALPGLGISAPKAPYLVVGAEPSPTQLRADIYPQALLSDMTTDIGLTIPRALANQLADRTIEEADQLNLTTRWKVANAESSMTAFLVQGSPYTTVEYNDLPINISGNNFLTISVEGGEPIAVPDLNAPSNPNKETPMGQVFKIVVGGVDNASCNKQNYFVSDGDGNKVATCLKNYSVYMVYTSRPVAFKFTATTPDLVVQQLTSTDEKFTGVVRIAYAGSELTSELPLNPIDEAKNVSFPETESRLTHYANTYPVSGDIQLNSVGNHQSDVVFQWKTKAMGLTSGNHELLMMAFKETQLPALKKGSTHLNIIESFTLPTLRGDMVGVVGNEWKQRFSLPLANTGKELWYGKNNIAPKFLDKVKEALDYDYKVLDDASNNGLDLWGGTFYDSYGFGKQVQRIARLAVIADQVGDTEKRDVFAAKTKHLLEKWFINNEQADANGDPNGANKQGFFRYDQLFGGMVTARASVQSDAEGCTNPADPNEQRCGMATDFVNGQYTDHHFHYGYFIYSAAVAAKYTKVDDHFKHSVEALIRDIANPSDRDTHFPTFRYFDWFEGHGLANGLNPGASGRNQESFSEALNAWYAISLWGDVVGRKDLTQLGRTLSAMEMLASQKFKQVTPNNSIYDLFEAKEKTLFNPYNHTVSMKNDINLGILWGLKADFTTFFGNKKAFIVGIDMMPTTPIIDDMYSNEWLVNNRANLINLLGNYNQLLGKFTTVDGVINDIKADYPDNVNDLGFWKDGFPTILRDHYSWSSPIATILAKIDPNAAVKHLFVDQVATLSKIEKAFENSDLIVKVKQGDKTVYRLKILNTEVDIGTAPFAAPTYAMLDKGTSFSNLLWWFATRDNLPDNLPWTAPDGGVTPPPPPPPVDKIVWNDNLRAVYVDKNAIQMEWEAATIKEGVIIYDVSLNGKVVAEQKALSYDFHGLQAGTEYTIGVTAKVADNTKVEPVSVIKTIKTKADDDDDKPKADFLLAAGPDVYVTITGDSLEPNTSISLGTMGSAPPALNFKAVLGGSAKVTIQQIGSDNKPLPGGKSHACHIRFDEENAAFSLDPQPGDECHFLGVGTGNVVAVGPAFLP